MTADALQALVRDSQRMPFVVLVTRLCQALGTGTDVGRDGPFEREPVRFRHDASLGFHSGDIGATQLRVDANGTPWMELTTRFAGLTGAVSPLPPSLVEKFCRDEHDEHAVQNEFLDLFHHRLLGFFYRGLLKFDVPRSTTNDTEGRALDWVLLLAGLAPQHAERLTGLARRQLLTLAPLLVCYPPNAMRLVIALRALLHDVLDGADVRVVEMRGTYVVLEPSARPKLGVDMLLGRTSTLGRRAPTPASDIAIEIAPLPPEACARLSPGGDRHHELRAVAQLFCPETIEVVVELTPTHVPAYRLGAKGARLGRDAWLSSHGLPAPIRMHLGPLQSRNRHHAS